MFKNLIYFDSNKVAEYGAVLEGKKTVAIKDVKLSSSKSISAKIPVVSGGAQGSNEMEGELVENLLLDCNEFEDLLESKSKDNYFDFLNNEYDSETIPRTSIVRFEGLIRIPEEFDMMDLLNQFKPMLSSNMNLQTEQEEELFRKIFSKESTKLPIFIESENINNRAGFAKLNSNNLLCELEELEDFEGEEVIIVAKVISKKSITDNKAIIVFDIMKDLLSLSGGIRRQMGNEEIEGIKSIESNEDILGLEVLAIYQ